MIECPMCGQATEYLTVKQVARLLDLDQTTVRRRIYKGRFPGAKPIVGLQNKKTYLIPASAVIPLIRKDRDEE